MPDPDKVPYMFDTKAYRLAKEWFDSEDVIAGLCLPLIQALTGNRPRFRDVLMGFLNQIIARNALSALGGEGLSPVTLHSAKSLAAGALVPIEDWIWKRKSLQSETFFRGMSKATVASLVAGTFGSMVGEALPAYTR